MTPKETLIKARELVDKFGYKNITPPNAYTATADDYYDYHEDLDQLKIENEKPKQYALICVDNEYNGIVYVLGDLKARGELSERIYLKAIEDLSKERQGVKKSIQEL